jgi:hypothetical protein
MQQTQLFIYINNLLKFYFLVKIRVLHCVGSTGFSGVEDLSNSLMSTRKVAMYLDCPQEAYTWRTWTGMGSVHVMLIRFSPIGCILIRITMTLGYE